MVKLSGGVIASLPGQKGQEGEKEGNSGFN